jgi:glutamate dehydrogenase/leucine dehydrogenase
MEIAQLGTIGEKNDPNKTNLMNIFKEINTSAFLDDWGPAHVLQVYNPDNEVYGILVIDNITLGPALGGIGISPLLTPYEVFQQARTMTLTCALANVKFGGAAAGIKANPLEIDILRTVRTFAKEISPFVPGYFIAAPKTHVGQDEIAAFVEEIGDNRGATGKPEHMGGIPYELGVVGLGIGVAIKTVIEGGQFSPIVPSSFSKTRIAICGFDNTGRTIARFLSNNNAKIVAISDDKGAICDPDGIELEKVLRTLSHSNGKNSVRNVNGYKTIKSEEILGIDCDVLILCNGKNIITEENVSSIDSKLIVEGENNSISFIADQILANKGVLVLPDILTKIGGAISSYAEINRNSSEMAFSLIESKIQEIIKEVVQQSIESGLSLRRIAQEIAKQRLLEAKEGVG